MLRGMDKAEEENARAADVARRAVIIRVVTAICHELLKLGCGSADRLIARELLKLLDTVCFETSAITQWMTPKVVRLFEKIILIEVFSCCDYRQLRY